MKGSEAMAFARTTAARGRRAYHACAMSTVAGPSLTYASTNWDGPRLEAQMKAPAHEAAEQQQAKADLGSLDAGPKHAVPPGYVHLGVAKGIYAVLKELGADPDEVISEAGVDPRI